MIPSPYNGDSVITRTATALLDDLLDSTNRSVWEEFDERYRPILISVALRLGCPRQDAADIAQEALMRFVRGYRAGEYDRSKGRLRSWLIGIARHTIIDQLRQRGRRREVAGASAVPDIADEPDRIEQAWAEAVDNHMLSQAIERLRSDTRMDEKTIRAFELVVLRDLSAPEAADALALSTNDVYLAKNRCLRKLRSFLTDLRPMYEEAPGD